MVYHYSIKVKFDLGINQKNVGRIIALFCHWGKILGYGQYVLKGCKKNTSISPGDN